MFLLAASSSSSYSWIYIVGAIGSILTLFSFVFVKAPGASLNRKFVEMGTLVGKTYADIKSKVGVENASSVTVNSEGERITVRQWMQTGYHIVLLFDKNDICMGISHESRV